MGLAIASFRVVVHCRHESISFELPVVAGAAASSDGMQVVLPKAIEAGAEHAVVAAASYGRGGFGPLSQPLLCRLAAGGSCPSRLRSSSFKKRGSFVGRSQRNIEIVEASGTAVGTFSLTWEAPTPTPPDLTWTVELERLNTAAESSKEEQIELLRVQDLKKCHASFIGLKPSTPYRFSITPFFSGQQHSPAPAPVVQKATKASSTKNPLQVTGTRFSSTSISPVALEILPTEGVVALPPFDHDVLAALKRDPRWRPFMEPSVFVRPTSKQ